MKTSTLSPKLIIGISIALLFGISLVFRILLPYDQVFSGEWIKFTSIDAYYQMHLVDNMAHNFPNVTEFDPYLIYPGGGGFGSIHFFNWFLAGVAWLIGLGSPSQHTVDVVGVYLPTILAALTIIPAYFIGKALFNRWAGVLAAGLVAVLPGEFLGRTFLGFTDTPAAETLLTTTTLAFLILAIKTAKERQLSLNHLKQHEMKVITRPLVYSLLAGVFLGIYLITWMGGMLFVVIISLYLIIQFIVNHLRNKSSDHLAFSGFIIFLIALFFFLPFSNFRDLNIALIGATLLPIVLCGISHLISSKNLKPLYYPVSLAGLGVIFIVAFYFISPAIFEAALLKFRMVFVPGGATAATTLEMQPFLSPKGSFSTAVAWGNYTTSFFLLPAVPIPGFAVISFAILIWLFIKQRSDEQHRLLFFVWTLIILIATLVQRRFAYYFVINIALLSAYLSWQVIWLAGLRRVTRMTKEPEATKAPKQKQRQGWTMYHVNVILAIIVVFVFVFLFNIIKSKEVASTAHFAPSDAWQESLLWMKENTPEPLDDPDAYYKVYEHSSQGAEVYTDTAYGVTSWWDYGYWITRIAHRMPNSNPSQAPGPITRVANLLLSQEETLTHEKMQELDSSYIMIDHDMVTGKFWAIATWSERELTEFTDMYHLPYEGKLVPVNLFYPAYYQTMLVRLYNFDGQSVTDVKPVVISYVEKEVEGGNIILQVTNLKEFSDYDEALVYIEEKEHENQVIVGISPFVSPIPLDKIDSYNMLYSSEHGIFDQSIGKISGVKIFEYTR